MQIYVSKDGAQAGPFSLDEFWKMVAEGKYSPSDYGWYDKLTEWVPLSTLFPAGWVKIQSAPAAEEEATAEHIDARSKSPAHVSAPTPSRPASTASLTQPKELVPEAAFEIVSPTIPNSIGEQSASNWEWHYSTDGQRFGPVPEDQITELIKQKKITIQSSVWNKTMRDWQPILASRFACFVRDPNVPPPLTGEAVSNAIIWVLAFAPLIGEFLQGFISGLTGTPLNDLWFITLILNVILCYADEKKLKAAGHDTSKMGAAWLVPVYLFKRAKILKHNYAYFIVWCVMFCLMLAF